MMEGGSSLDGRIPEVFNPGSRTRAKSSRRMGGSPMATYILLMNWTDQGIKTVKDSPKRLDAARAIAKKGGCELRDFYMTIGKHDMIAVLEAPDDEAAAKFVLNAAAPATSARRR